MPRQGMAFLLATASFAYAQSVPGAVSPFDLAQSIDAGNRIDWNTVSEALAGARILPHCGDSKYSACSTEIIDVPSPAQIILLVEQEEMRTDLFLRYMKSKDGWNFTGYHESDLKYYPSRHGMMHFGRKAFMKISTQGESGTGIASEIEEWFDLTLPAFEPVFSFPVQGHRKHPAVGISRELTGFASQSRNTAVEEIRLTQITRFSFLGNDLGETTLTGIYQRQPGESKFTLRRATASPNIVGPGVPVANKDFEKMTQMFNGPEVEELLVYVLPGLKALIADADVDTRQDLRTFADQLRRQSGEARTGKAFGTPG